MQFWGFLRKIRWAHLFSGLAASGAQARSRPGLPARRPPHWNSRGIRAFDIGSRELTCASGETLLRGDVASGSYVADNRVILEIVTIARIARASSTSLKTSLCTPPGSRRRRRRTRAVDAKRGPTVRAQGMTFIPLACEVPRGTGARNYNTAPGPVQRNDNSHPLGETAINTITLP